MEKKHITLGELHENDIFSYRNVSYILDYGYKFFHKKSISMRAISGLSYGKYTHRSIGAKANAYDILMDEGQEWTLGFQAGLNASVSIWKGILLNSSARYTINPFTDFKRHRQTLFFDIGIGYQF